MPERETLARVVPFAVYMSFIVIADLLTRLGWSAQELRWLYAVKIAAVLAVLVYYRRHYVELRWRRLPWRTVAIAVATGVLVLVLWINLDAGWMSIGEAAGFDPRVDGRIDWRLAAVRLLGATLVVPVMEELFWRSFLARWLESPAFLTVDPSGIKIRAFIVTVILFGFEHNLWLAGIVAGTAYSLLYIRSRTLWTAIVAHAVTNGLLGCWILATGMWIYW